MNSLNEDRSGNLRPVLGAAKYSECPRRKKTDMAGRESEIRKSQSETRYNTKIPKLKQNVSSFGFPIRPLQLFFALCR
jgi:hypothetical protein